MMKSLIFPIAIALSFLLTPPYPAQARQISPDSPEAKDLCLSEPTISPTKKTREVYIKKYGVSIKIPANYKTETNFYSGKLSVYVYNPTHSKAWDCFVKNNIISELDFSTLHIIAGSTRADDSMFDTANRIHEGVKNTKKTTSNGYNAIAYSHISLTGEERRAVLLFAPGRKKFVTFSRSSSLNEQDFSLVQKVISSIEFR
jgi:hypothetical protein